MATTRHLVLILSSVILLLLIALSLATAVELRGPPQKLVQVSVAQAARIGGANDLVSGAKARLNDTEFDRGDVYHGTSIVSGVTAIPTVVTETQEGLIGFAPTSAISAPTSTQATAPSPNPIAPPLFEEVPILALSYSGAGGPKHCRGSLIQRQSFAPPRSNWKNGTCINLPSEARCGVFYAGKDDNCEAQLFNMRDCYNTTRTYVNTVVFMPEERAVGALWSSMFVRCGVEVPPAKLIDPAVLGGLLKKPGKNSGG